MEENWSMILNTAIAFLCVALVSFCVPLLKARLGEDRFAALQSWITIGVQAAEQLFGSGEGQKKKDYVLSLLLDKGLVNRPDDVAALLESEVYQLNR